MNITQQKERLFISDYGLVNAIGHDQKSVAANWQRGVSEGMTNTDVFLPGQNTVVGAVQSQLPPIPKHLKHYNCRNNQLLLHTVGQIRESIEAVNPSSTIAHSASSVADAAASVCPVRLFVELHRVFSVNSSLMIELSTASLSCVAVPCKLT